MVSTILLLSSMGEFFHAASLRVVAMPQALSTPRALHRVKKFAPPHSCHM